MNRTCISALIVLLGSVSACATVGGHAEPESGHHDVRAAAIARAQIWKRTDIGAMDIKEGPGGKGAFPFRATVYCDYLDKKMTGDSAKFACVIGKDDEVVGTTHFIADQTDPLWQYSDAAFHKKCFDAWERP